MLSFALIFISFLITRSCQCGARTLVLELPSFRLPGWRELLREAHGTARAYLFRAVSAVTVCCAVFSVLAMLTPSLHFVKNGSESILFALTHGLSILFRPLGFAGKETVAALIFGFFAKENMICVLQT
jgi:ferrous iron transport protein B